MNEQPSRKFSLLLKVLLGITLAAGLLYLAPRLGFHQIVIIAPPAPQAQLDQPAPAPGPWQPVGVNALPALPPAPAKFVAPDKGKQYDVLINDEFTEDLAKKVLADAEKAAKDHPRVLVKFMSPGGELWSMWQVIGGLEDLKKNHPGVKIVCYADVLLASAAAISFEAVCDERYLTAQTSVLFHEAQGGVGGGNEARAQEAVDAIHATDESLDSVVAARLGMSLADYRLKVYGRNWWLRGQALVDVHGADSLVDRMDTPAVKPDDKALDDAAVKKAVEAIMEKRKQEKKDSDE